MISDYYMGGKSLLSKDMMVVNGGTELGRDSSRRKIHIWWQSTGAG